MKDLTNGNSRKLILQFAWPMLLGNLFQQLYNIVDSIIVGNFLGKEALAAVGASFPVIFVLISLIIGIASGTTIVIAQYFGAKEMGQVKKAIGTMYIFMFFAAIAITIAGILLAEKIFLLMQLPENLLPEAKKYLTIYLSGMIVFFGYNGTSAILRGLGDSKTPMVFLIIATLANIIFDLLFVIVFKWGVGGVAYATILSQAGAFLTAIIYLNRHHQVIHIGIKSFKWDAGIFRQSFRIGLPTGLQHTFVSLGITAVMGIVNTFGTDVIAGFSVASRLDTIASMPAMAFSAALATFVGQNIGANKPERVRSGLNSSLVMSGIIAILVTLLMVFFGAGFMRLFTDDTEVIRIGSEYLTIVSSFYLVFTAMFMITGVLRGAGDTLIPMFITLISLWIVRIPLSYFLAGKMGETGIWWAMPTGWAFGLLASFIYYKTGNWKKKVVVKAE